MKYANIEERTRIMKQALRATTLVEIASATKEMDSWVEAHPDDWGIRDAYEVLENMQEIAEFQQQAEHNQRAPAEMAA